MDGGKHREGKREEDTPRVSFEHIEISVLSQKERN